LRKDIVIPLVLDESKSLVEKLNELIPIEKERALRDLAESERVKKEFGPRRAEMEKEEYRERPRH
jgi:hypothetical protein